MYNQRFMSQEQFWVLYSKKLAGEASIDELNTLSKLITEHPEWQYAIQNLEDLWNHKLPNDFTQEEDAYMLHVHRMKELNIPFGEYTTTDSNFIDTKRTKTFKKWYWAAAAVLILSGLFGFKKFLSPVSSSKEIVHEVNEISTRPGSKSKVQLPDGSVVWLNAGSKLTYTKDFGKELREVTLTGEGFFDVTKNKEKPFIINTPTINIKVLGTAFNVKAYPEDKETETSLIRGSIEVTIKNRPHDKIILSPSEKLVVENTVINKEADAKELKKSVELPAIVNPLVSINKLRYNPSDSTVVETQWVNNKLVFRNETFNDVAIRMERWYDVQIDVTDEKIASEHLSGSFETETIQQALEALKESIPFQYDKKGSHIIIHR